MMSSNKNRLGLEPTHTHTRAPGPTARPGPDSGELLCDSPPRGRGSVTALNRQSIRCILSLLVHSSAVLVYPSRRIQDIPIQPFFH